MASIGEIFVKVGVDSSGFEKGIDAISSRVEQAASLIKTAFQFEIVKKAIDIVGDLGNAWGEQEAAIIRLTQAAKNNPLLSGSFVKNMLDYSGALMRSTGVEEEAIQNQIAFAAGLGRTEDQIKKITKAALDWSAGGTISFESAFQVLTRSYSGQMGMIGRLIPGMKDLTQAELEQGAAVDFVGKKFNGLAEEVNKGYLGTQKNLQNSIDELKESFGKLLAPAIIGVTQFLTGMVNAIEKMPDTTKRAILVVAGLSAGAFVAVKAFQGLSLAFKALTTANPMLLAITAAIAALVYTISKLEEAYNDAIDPLNKLTEKQKQSVEETDKLFEQYKKYSEQTNQTKESQANLRQTTEDLIKKYPELRDNVDKYTGTLRLTEDQIINIQIREKEALRETLQNQKTQQEALVESLKKQLDAYDAMPDWWKTMMGIAFTGNVISIAKASLDRTTENITKITDEVKALNDEIDKLKHPEKFKQSEPTVTETKKAQESPLTEQWSQEQKDRIKDVADFYKDHWQESISAVQDSINKYGGLASDIANRISSIFNQISENASINAENEYNDRKKWIEANVTDEGQRATQLAQLEQEKQDKLRGIKQQAWQAEKTANVISAVMNTAQAVTKAFADWGWPWGLIPAAIVGALGTAQVALIASQPMPQFAGGGMVKAQPGGQAVIMAENRVNEYAVPDDKSIWGQIGNKISASMDRPINNNINNSVNFPSGITVRIGDREFFGMLTDASEAGKFSIHPTRGIRKR